MEKTPEGTDDRTGVTTPAVPTERVVYVMPEDALRAGAGDEIDLLRAWQILWQGKWWIVGITALFAVASVAYALTLTHWFKAEVLLAPAEQKAVPDIGGSFGALVGLAGISVGGRGNAEALAVLSSRDFARGFIEDESLLTVFFADRWDVEQNLWKDEDPEQWPDLREAVKYFDENILSVQEDEKTGLVTLVIEWTNPELAGQWADDLVKRLNDHMRADALAEAQTNVGFLQRELASTSLVALDQSIGRLLESELQKLMLAKGNEEFAFRVIDSAEVPKRPSKPRRRLIVLLAVVLGGALSVFVVFLRHLVKSQRSDTVEGTAVTALGSRKE